MMTESKALQEFEAICRECWKENHISCEDCATQIAIQSIRDFMKHEEKRGTWTRFHTWWYLCSNCHTTVLGPATSYCPDCGARMEGHGD